MTDNVQVLIRSSDPKVPSKLNEREVYTLTHSYMENCAGPRSAIGRAPDS